jgi:hypothetical protein
VALTTAQSAKLATAELAAERIISMLHDKGVFDSDDDSALAAL